MSFVSYAQNYEDVTLYRALRHVECGSYIDVGAGHPENDSVTKAFYDRGWRGINIDPDPHFAKLLRDTRPRDVTIEAAVADSIGRVTIHLMAGVGLSTLDAEIAKRHTQAGLISKPLDVDVTTLAAICRDYVKSDIHFLKIDAEGAEREILQGANFIKFRPWIIVVEATEPNTPTPNHSVWESILLDARYTFVWFDGLNRFYVAKEQEAALRPALQAPPNYFDHFVRANEAKLSAYVESAKASAADAEARAKQAEEQSKQAEARAKQAEEQSKQAEARAKQAEEQSKQTEAAHKRAIAAIAALHASTCWRITAPLRTIRNLLW